VPQGHNLPAMGLKAQVRLANFLFQC
jgi:hypothetical protein